MCVFTTEPCLIGVLFGRVGTYREERQSGWLLSQDHPREKDGFPFCPSSRSSPGTVQIYPGKIAGPSDVLRRRSATHVGTTASITHTIARVTKAPTLAPLRWMRASRARRARGVIVTSVRSFRIQLLPSVSHPYAGDGRTMRYRHAAQICRSQRRNGPVRLTATV